jgi:hypothetical protein
VTTLSKNRNRTQWTLSKRYQDGKTTLLFEWYGQNKPFTKFMKSGLRQSLDKAGKEIQRDHQGKSKLSRKDSIVKKCETSTINNENMK